MTLPIKFCVALICSVLFLTTHAQEQNSREREQASLIRSLKEHDFSKLQAVTDQWLRDYEDNKITGDEFVEHLARLHPANVKQISPASDAELWVEKYPKSYAANYLFGVVLSQTAIYHTNKFTATGSKSEQLSQFEKYSKLAEDQFLKSATLFSRPYPTYCRLIQVAKDLSSEMKSEYFERALSIDSKAYAAYAALLDALALKSGGSIEKLNDAVIRAKSSGMNFDDLRKLEALQYEIIGEYAKTKDTEAAIELYRRSYRIDPRPETLWRLVEAGDIARQKGYDDRAIDLYGQVLTIDPANANARKMRAFVFENKKSDLKSALADYLILVEAGDIWAQIQLGQIYMDGKLTKADYDLAATYFQMAATKGNPNAILKLRELENRKNAVKLADRNSMVTAPARPEVKAAEWVPALEAHDFQKLQATTDAWLQDYVKNKISGDALIERLSIFYPDGSFRARWQKDVELWLEKYPASYAASHVLGDLLASTAAQRRGGRFLSETTVQQLADYEKYSKLAEEQLFRSIALFAKPYPTYCALMAVAKHDGAEYYRLALKIDPKAFKAHSIHLSYLAPKWGGSIAEVDAAIATSKSSGMSSVDNRRLDALGYEIKGDDARNRNDLDAAISLYRTSYLTAPGPTRLWRLIEAAAIARKAGDTDRALGLYSEVIEIDKANIQALTWRGRLYEKEKRDPKAALTDYMVAAAAGDIWAQNQVGWMYMNGVGIDKNFDLAETYFRKAEAQGDAYALQNLQRLDLLRRTHEKSERLKSEIGVKM